MNRKHTETMINSFTLSQLIEMSGDNRQGLNAELRDLGFYRVE